MPIEPDHTSYKVLDFLKWQRDGTLILRPPFQRKAVWRPALKSSLIDSLLRGYPVPALFLQDRSDAASFERRLIVIDGQQRLRTALSYVDVSCLPDADEKDDFVLLPMHDESRSNATFDDLPEEDRHQILNSRFTVYLVDSSVTESELLEIFRRMNTYGAKLNAQELRNAQYSGLFKELSYGLASEFFDLWISWGTLNKQQIAEMRDAEFTSDLMLLAMRGVSASTKSSLDEAYEDLDEIFPDADACAKRVREMMSALDRIYRGPHPVKRLTTRMWLYSLFDAIQEVRFGGPLERSTRAKQRISTETLRQVARRINDAIEEDRLPDAVGRATRGAANDRQSREARAKFVIDQLDEA
jgi:hypothetical protein